MDIVEAIFLGLLQGLTEFIPVSSSGHLVLAHNILGIEEGAVFFSVMLHAGTLAAVFAVFWKDLLGLFKPPFKRLALLALASVPAALAGFFLSGVLEGFFAGGRVLPFMFLATAVLLAVTEIISTKRAKAAPKKQEAQPDGAGNADACETRNAAAPQYAGSIGIKTAAIMGLAQAAAVIPGLSRSGATICAGVLSGAKREKAAKFSFFMSVPIILGSALYSLVKGGGAAAAGISPLAVIAGMAAAAGAGFFAIKLMMKVISKSNYKWFSVYLAALFAGTLVYYYIIL